MMKPRFLDAMGEALDLVRKSKIAEATALLRKTLSGEEARAARAIRNLSPSFRQVPPLRPRRGVH